MKQAPSRLPAPAVTPVTAPRPQTLEDLSGKAKLAISDRLVNRWERLGVYFEIPLFDQEAFKRDYQPPLALLNWLDQRRRIWQLRDAFNFLGWDDLIKEFDLHTT